jgi:DDE superfamily endonuclease
MLFYPAALPLSTPTLRLVAGLIRGHRRAIRSRWRRLSPAEEALMVLVVLKKGEPFAQVGAGFGVSATTCWRRVRQVVDLLAARAEGLVVALRRARRRWGFVIVDGTLVHTDRLAADRPFFSGKHRHHGVNIQVVAAPDGTLLWASGGLPGSVHDTAAARIWRIGAALERSGLVALGDKGYHRYHPRVHTPFKGRGKPDWKKDINRDHARLRAPGERANAQLKSWLILRQVRCGTDQVTKLVRAVAVLHNYELASR